MYESKMREYTIDKRKGHYLETADIIFWLVATVLLTLIFVTVSIKILNKSLMQEPIIEAPTRIVYVYMQKPTLQDESEKYLEEGLPTNDIPLTEEQLIDSYVDDICRQYQNIPPQLIKSVIWHESTYDPKAINYNGTCFGLMQIAPRWHKDRMAKLGVTDIYDPYGNILVGVDYLSELFTRYEDMGLVLMMYNMSHNKAFEIHKQGRLTKYAQSVLDRAETL